MEKPTRDETYIAIACEIAKRSKDPSTKVGAVIAETLGPIISVGFNGPPSTFDDEKVQWTRPEKYGFIIHAEHNAILYALRSGRNWLSGCSLYCNGRICSRCMLVACQVGIDRVVMGSILPQVCDEVDWLLVKRLANMGGVELCSMT